MHALTTDSTDLPTIRVSVTKFSKQLLKTRSFDTQYVTLQLASGRQVCSYTWRSCPRSITLIIPGTIPSQTTLTHLT